MALAFPPSKYGLGYMGGGHQIEKKKTRERDQEGEEEREGRQGGQSLGGPCPHSPHRRCLARPDPHCQSLCTDLGHLAALGTGPSQALSSRQWVNSIPVLCP